MTPECLRAAKAASAAWIVKWTNLCPVRAFARVLSRACGRHHGFFMSRHGAGPPGRNSARVQLEHGGVRMVTSNSLSLMRASYRA